MHTDYLTNLDRWQASSHPKLTDRGPEELFHPTFVAEYRRRHEDLWTRITRLHGTLQCLKELDDFPFDWIYGPVGMEFWHLVVEHFGDMACIMLHSLTSDAVPGANTIPAFRNAIITADWLRADDKSLLCCELKARAFDAVSTDIAKRVTLLRHTRLAHAIIRADDGLQAQLKGVRLDDLLRLFDATHGLFGALSFGSAYATLAGDLIPHRGGNNNTCLTTVLDAVLRDSDFVNEPERADFWPALRDHIDPAQLQVMNECRKRVGLPES